MQFLIFYSVYSKNKRAKNCLKWSYFRFYFIEFRGKDIQQKTFTQYAEGEFKKLSITRKKTVTTWKYNTYWVRNHFVPNPINSKFIRLKKFSKNIFLLQQNIEKVRTNKKNLWCSTEIFNLTAASQLVSWSNTSTLFNYFDKKAVTF